VEIGVPSSVALETAVQTAVDWAACWDESTFVVELWLGGNTLFVVELWLDRVPNTSIAVVALQLAEWADSMG
jgi:hypothetical protein